MALKTSLLATGQLDEIIAHILRRARIPGAALAIVLGEKTVFAKGYGQRDLEARLPLTAATVYPIASTSKAINATLIGMLVDEGRLAWDAPVQTYLPSFRLGDTVLSTQVTLRDLIVMRTGLPRHDWLWLQNPISRAQIARCLQHLELAAPFRTRFQYNNLTVCTAGHIAEIVTGKSWEALVQERLLDPLGMKNTFFALPQREDVTRSYLENAHRELVLAPRLLSEVAAPSGGAMHSTIEDMARWMAFNLAGGRQDGRALVQARTLLEIHSPQIPARSDPSCPTPHASYAMGWFVDTYNGHVRISHGGYLHAVNSDVSLFPQHQLGLICFTNFGPPPVTRLINQHAFDLLAGCEPVETVEQKLAEYEKKVAATSQRNSSVRRTENTAPSHRLADYTGTYVHPGYGPFGVELRGGRLELQRHGLTLPLDHWHYDVWSVADNDLFEIHRPHAFDRASRVVFETDADGQICGLAFPLEAEVPPVRFAKQSEANSS